MICTRTILKLSSYCCSGLSVLGQFSFDWCARNNGYPTTCACDLQTWGSHCICRLRVYLVLIWTELIREPIMLDKWMTLDNVTDHLKISQSFALAIIIHNWLGFGNVLIKNEFYIQSADNILCALLFPRTVPENVFIWWGIHIHGIHIIETRPCLLQPLEVYEVLHWRLVFKPETAASSKCSRAEMMLGWSRSASRQRFWWCFAIFTLGVCWWDHNSNVHAAVLCTGRIRCLVSSLAFYLGNKGRGNWGMFHRISDALSGATLRLSKCRWGLPRSPLGCHLITLSPI